MALKHRITINVTDPHGRTGTVLKGADVKPVAEVKEEKPVKKAEKKQKAKEVTLTEVRAVLGRSLRRNLDRGIPAM